MIVQIMFSEFFRMRKHRCEVMIQVFVVKLLGSEHTPREGNRTWSDCSCRFPEARLNLRQPFRFLLSDAGVVLLQIRSCTRQR